MCEPPGTGLAGHWPGDGGVGDAIGSRHGTLDGMVNFASGRAGYAFQFRGPQDSINFESKAEVNFTEDASVAAWVKFTDTKAEITIARQMSPDFRSGWVLTKDESDAFMFCLGNSAGRSGCRAGSKAAVISRTRAVAGTWNHIAATLAKDELSLYVNGVLESATKVGARHAVSPNPQLVIGAFKGLVDEVVLYYRALTPIDIRKLVDVQKCILSGAGSQPARVS
jgi:hypothetical protein